MEREVQRYYEAARQMLRRYGMKLTVESDWVIYQTIRAVFDLMEEECITLSSEADKHSCRN